MFLIGYYHQRPLPSSGLGPYTYAMICLTELDVEYDNLGALSYEDSRLSLYVNRWAIFFNFLDTGFSNKQSSPYMFELFTSLINTINFYKVHKNKTLDCKLIL